MTKNCFLAAVVFWLLLAPFNSFSQRKTITPLRTDKIFLKNGNMITGEIKKLEYGVLSFKTDNIGTLTVKWKDVMRITSIHRFELVTTGNIVSYGSIDSTSKSKQVVLVWDTASTVLDIRELTRAVPINNSFFSRMDGNIKLGSNYSKSSDIFRLNLNGALYYRSFHDLFSITGNSEITRQNISDSAEVIKKQDLSLVYARYFKKRWFISALGALEQNTGLGMKLRTYIGTAGGKEIFQNHVHTLTSATGVLGNREKSTEGNYTTNVEGLILMTYRIYKYTIPKVIFSSYVYAYPSLTDPGRVRLNGNLNVDFEFFTDFIFSITNYHNYDSRPATSSALKYDWGFTTSIGYTF